MPSGGLGRIVKEGDDEDDVDGSAIGESVSQSEEEAEEYT